MSTEEDAKVEDEGSKLHLILEGKELPCVAGWFESTNPAVSLLALRTRTDDDTNDSGVNGNGNSWRTIYTSEAIPDLKEGAHPRWKKAVISLFDLCENDTQRLIRIQVDSIPAKSTTTKKKDESDNSPTILSMGYLDTTVDNILQAAEDPEMTAELRYDGGTDDTDSAAIEDYGSLVVRHARIQKTRKKRSEGASVVNASSELRRSSSWNQDRFKGGGGDYDEGDDNVQPRLSSSLNALRTTTATMNNHALDDLSLGSSVWHTAALSPSPSADPDPAADADPSTGAISISIAAPSSSSNKETPHIVIPSDLLNEDVLFELTLEADLIFGGAAIQDNNNISIQAGAVQAGEQLTTLMETVVAGWGGEKKDSNEREDGEDHSDDNTVGTAGEQLTNLMESVVAGWGTGESSVVNKDDKETTKDKDHSGSNDHNDSVSTGAGTHLTNLMESVVAGWGGSVGKDSNRKEALEGEDHSEDELEEEEDDEQGGSKAGWFEATTTQLGTLLVNPNPYFQVSTITQKGSSIVSHHQQADYDDSISLLTTTSSNTLSPKWQERVYRSEHLIDCVNPLWKSAKIPLHVLCGGDLHRTFRIAIYSKRDDNNLNVNNLISAASRSVAKSPPISLGYFDTTVMELKRAAKYPDKVFFVPKSKDGTKQYGTVRVVEATLPDDLDVSVSSHSSLDDDLDVDAMQQTLGTRHHEDDDNNQLISEITGHVVDVGTSLSEAVGEWGKEMGDLVAKGIENNGAGNENVAESILATAGALLGSASGESEELDGTIRAANLKKRSTFESGDGADDPCGSSDGDEGQQQNDGQGDEPLAKLQGIFMSALQANFGDEGDGDDPRKDRTNQDDDDQDSRSDQASRFSMSAESVASSILPDVANRFLQVMSNLQMKEEPLQEATEDESKDNSVDDEEGVLPVEIGVPATVERDPNAPPKLFLTLRGKDLKYVGRVTGSADINPLFQISASKGKTWDLVYRSEHVTKSMNPKWREAAIDFEELCQGDLKRPLRVSIYSLKGGNRRSPMGFFSTSVSELMKSSVYAGKSPKSFGSGFGSIIVMKAEIFPSLASAEGRWAGCGNEQQGDERAKAKTELNDISSALDKSSGLNVDSREQEEQKAKTETSLNDQASGAEGGIPREKLSEANAHSVEEQQQEETPEATDSDLPSAPEGGIAVEKSSQLAFDFCEQQGEQDAKTEPTTIDHQSVHEGDVALEDKSGEGADADPSENEQQDLQSSADPEGGTVVEQTSQLEVDSLALEQEEEDHAAPESLDHANGKEPDTVAIDGQGQHEQVDTETALSLGRVVCGREAEGNETGQTSPQSPEVALASASEGKTSEGSVLPGKVASAVEDSNGVGDSETSTREPPMSASSFPSTADLLQEFESRLSDLKESDHDGRASSEQFQFPAPDDPWADESEPHAGLDSLAREDNVNKTDRQSVTGTRGDSPLDSVDSDVAAAVLASLDSTGQAKTNMDESSSSAHAPLTGINATVLQTESSPASSGADLLQDFEATLARLSKTDEADSPQPDEALPEESVAAHVNIGAPPIHNNLSNEPDSRASAPATNPTECLPNNPDVSNDIQHEAANEVANNEESTDLLQQFEATLKRLSMDGTNTGPLAILSEPDDVASQSSSVGVPNPTSHEIALAEEREALVQQELEETKELLRQAIVGSDKLRASIEKSDTVIQQLRKEVHSSRAEKDAAEASLRKHEEEKEVVMSFNKELLDQVSSIECKAKEKDLLLVGEKEKNDRIAAQMSSLESQLHQVEQQKVALETALSESKAAVSMNKSKLDEAADSLTSMKIEKDVLAQSIEDEKRANALREEKLAAENEGLVDELMKMRAELEQMVASLEQKSAVMIGYEDERKKHLDDILLLTGSLEEAEAKAAGRVSQLEESMEVNDRLIVNMKMQLDTLRAEKTELENTVADVRRTSEETLADLRREMDESAARQVAREDNNPRLEIGDVSYETRLAEKSTLARRTLETTLVEAEINLLMRDERAQNDNLRINALTTEINALKAQLNLGGDRGTPVQSSSVGQAQIDELQTQCQALVEEKNALERSLKDAEDLARRYKSDLTESDRKSLMLSESVKARDRLVEKAQQELASLAQEKLELERSLTRERIENEAKLKEANNRVSGNISEALKATLTQAGAKVKVFEEKAVADAATIQELTAKNTAMSTRLAEVEKVLQHQAQAAQQVREELKLRDQIIAVLKAEKSELDRSLQEVKTDKDALVTACRILEASSKDREGELSQLETAKNEAAMLDEEVKDLRAKIPQLESDSKGLHQDLAEARKQITDLEESLQSKESDLQLQREIVADLKQSSKSASSGDTEADREMLAGIEAERDAALKKSKKLQDQVKELKKDLDGAIFAKGLYEGYWKDANAKIEAMKGSTVDKKESRLSVVGGAAKRKSSRKSVSSMASIASKSLASDDGTKRSEKRKSKRDASKRLSVVKESSLRKSVRESSSTDGLKPSEHKRKSRRPTAKGALSTDGKEDGMDSKSKPSEISIPTEVASEVSKSSLRRAVGRASSTSIAGAEGRKSVRRSKGEAARQDKEKKASTRVPRKSKTLSGEDQETREAARAKRASTRKSTRERKSERGEKDAKTSKAGTLSSAKSSIPEDDFGSSSGGLDFLL